MISGNEEERGIKTWEFFIILPTEILTTGLMRESVLSKTLSWTETYFMLAHSGIYLSIVGLGYCLNSWGQECD